MRIHPLRAMNLSPRGISLRNFLAHLHDAAEEVQITAYLCTFHPTKYIMSDNGLISD